MWMHYITIALRHLWKYKVQNLIGIIGLTVGLFCLSIPFYIFNVIYGVDECYSNSDRLIRVEIEQGKQGHSGSEDGGSKQYEKANLILAQCLREMSLPEVETACTLIPSKFPLPYALCQDDGKEKMPYSLYTVETDTCYKRAFTPHIVYGSWQAAARTGNALVLTESAVRLIFGKNVNPVGRQLQRLRQYITAKDTLQKQAGSQPIYTIQAVIEDIPHTASIRSFHPLHAFILNDAAGYLGNPQKEYIPSNVRTEILLRPEATLSALQHRLQEGVSIDSHSEKRYHLTYETPGEKLGEGGIAPMPILIIVIGGLIFLSGLLNFFYFQWATFRSRLLEYSLRKVTGATGWHLFGLLTTQLFLTTFATGIFLFAAIELTNSSWYLTLGPYKFELDPGFVRHCALIYLLFLAMAEATLSGYAAWRFQRANIRKGLFEGRIKRKYGWRNLMLGVQFFVCFLFTGLASAFYMQTTYTSQKLYSFLSKEEKQTIFRTYTNYPGLKEEQKQEILNRIQACHAIKETTILTRSIDYITTLPGEDDSENNVEVVYVDRNYFSFFHIPLTEGNPIKGHNQMVIDERLEQQEQLLGKACYLHGKVPYEVCGVSTPVIQTVHHNLPPQLYILKEDATPLGYWVKAWPGKEAEVKAYLETMWKELFPGATFTECNSLYEELKVQTALEDRLGTLFLFLSVTCLSITLLGVYSAITFDTDRRQKEMAIRKVNGAKVKDITLLFARLYIVLLAVSAAAAFPLLGLMLGYLKQLYTTYFDYGAWYWIALFVVVTAFTTLTVGFKIRRIARLNPADIIKNE